MQFPNKFRLARVIRTRGGKEGVLPIARAIYQTHLKNIRPFRAMIPFFLNVCYTVDKVKVETIGQTAPTDVSNNVQMAIGHELIMDPEVQWDNRDIEWLNETYSLFESASEHMSRWGATKLAIMMNSMKHVDNTHRLAAQPIQLPEHQLRLLESEYDSTEAHISEMMERLMELRRYGVKSSFTKQGFVPSANHAWVMWDFREFIQPFGISQKGLVAEVALATEASQIKDLRLELTPKEHIDSRGYTLPFPALFTWTMDKGAEFDVSMGLGSLPVREIFRRAGQDVFYQAVRMQLMYHLYDLVVPVAKLATLPSAPTMKAGPLAKLRAALGYVEKSPVVDLFVPRMRLLDNHAEIVEALEKEIDEGASETERRAKRRHDVTDFIRPLPKGYHPSALARKRAFEAFGIELADNETYVRAHERGVGEKITAHRAKTTRDVSEV